MTMTQHIGESSFYKTSDLSLAASLYLVHPLEVIDKTSNPHKSDFVFAHTNDLDAFIDRFWRGELQVEPRRYFEALRAIKARLYD